MRRGLIRGTLVAVAFAISVHFAAVGSARDAARPPVLERFLAGDNSAPTQYRALRRLDANSGFSSSAWMDVWTEADGAGFRYEIVAEGGSSYIRSRVFTPALETERRMWASDRDHSAITPDNYLFEDRGAEPTGLAWVGLKPRRKDVLLVDGSIFLRPDSGDLVRIQGLLSKNPSFWTRRVEIVRRYERIAGIRVPVSLESVASVLVAGKSRFTMTYHYETLNDQPVGTPIARSR